MENSCRNLEAFAWAGNRKGKNGTGIAGGKNGLYKGMEVGRGIVGPGSENPSWPIVGPMDPQQKTE